ncbi:tail chaperonin [Paenibacillus rhizovicinus]|uniref:tail chaperonin n=1 Tax=Paenibacillus rhizovicinus TaxID=2704463 RepID=UPI001CDC1B5C|nr:tail chaperonin [Paenibacillus rhizovicinus]
MNDNQGPKQPDLFDGARTEGEDGIMSGDKAPAAGPSGDEQEAERIVVAYGYTQEELETEIFPEGPTRLEVEQWKEKYRGVYFTPFDDEVFVWRTLERPEYKECIADRTLTQLDREEIYTEKCVLFPRNYSREKMRNDKAGIPSLLAEMIMDKSGFVAQAAPIKL